jgi:hypothetical protein
MFARWEWIIIELFVLALLIWEWVRTRRLVKADKAKAMHDDKSAKD